MSEAGTLERFVPFDVDEETLRSAAAAIAEEYPGIRVHAVVGDFERHLAAAPRRQARGWSRSWGARSATSTPAVRAQFLADLAAALAPGDLLLLGVDLVKSPDRILAAYDDPGGVTAEFSRNVLRILNNRLDADFEPEAFDHVPRWDAANEWVDIRLRARTAQTVRIAALDLRVEFAEGEEMHTEISAKFRRDRLEAELAGAGLEVRRWWTDPGDGLRRRARDPPLGFRRSCSATRSQPWTAASASSPSASRRFARSPSASGSAPARATRRAGRRASRT